MRIEHNIVISNSASGIVKLLEHLRYGGDIQIKHWSKIKVEDDNKIIKTIGFRINLIYRGSKRFWLSHVKKRSESIGLKVIEV